MAMTRIEDGIQDTEPIRFLELLGLDEEDLAGYVFRQINLRVVTS